jgi:TPR repeat protein
MAFLFGRYGVPKDLAQAVPWLRLSAEHEDARAQFFLGTLHEDGAGVPQSQSEAVGWYRKAAAQGLAEAQQRLAELL